MRAWMLLGAPDSHAVPVFGGWRKLPVDDGIIDVLGAGYPTRNI